jgi:hypothetical protein
MATLDMTPSNVVLVALRGDTFAVELEFVDGVTGDPIDLTPSTFTAQIRRRPGEDDVLATFACTKTDPTRGVLLLELTGEQVATLHSGVVFDVQTVTAGVTRTFVAGELRFEQDVTR